MRRYIKVNGMGVDGSAVESTYKTFEDELSEAVASAIQYADMEYLRNTEIECGEVGDYYKKFICITAVEIYEGR